jgi:flagellar biosynthesis chaperone FliJ
MKRLVDLGEHAVRMRKQALAASTRASDEAVSAQSQLEHAWNERANEVTSVKMLSFAAFTEERATLDAMHGQAAQAAKMAAVAVSAVDKNREALSDANVELKKLELWQGNVQGAMREVENKLERAQSDETAARIRGKKS